MQYIENDMDDLFRKAAQNYPLKTEAKGWDDIAGALAPQANGAAVANKKTKRKKQWLILLAFLIISSFISFYTYTNNGQLPSSGAIAKNIPQLKNAEPVDEKVNGIQANPTSIQTANIVGQKNKIKYKNPAGNDLSIVGQNHLEKKFKQILSAHTNPASIENTSEDFIESTLVTNDVLSKGLTKAGTDDLFAVKEKEAGKNKETINTEDSALEVNAKPAGKTKAAPGSRGFYFGVVAGPQFSQVKGQGFSKTGFDAGVLAGFRVNKKFSAEAGLLYAVKHYYSNGKYFDMTKAGAAMPVNMQLISLNGSSSFFEILAKVKYDFITAKKSTWFIGTGISSYLLTKESNDYFVTINGVQQNLHARYENNKGYFLTTVDVSFGSEFKIGKQAALRVEPYWQIPLKGVGVGVMPLSGAGLHIGFVFPAHK